MRACASATTLTGRDTSDRTRRPRWQTAGGFDVAPGPLGKLPAEHAEAWADRRASGLSHDARTAVRPDTMARLFLGRNAAISTDQDLAAWVRTHALEHHTAGQ